MQYIDINTQQHISLGQLRKQHPRTAFPRSGPDDDWLSANGYARYVQTSRPAIDNDTEYATDEGPVLVDGQWQSDWHIKDKSYEDGQLTRYREQRIAEGITVGGVTLQTDDQSQQRIIGARVAAEADSNYTVRWKTPNGFATLDAAQIIAVSNAVRDHVQKCFDAEAAIEDNKFTTIKEMRSAFDAAYNEG